MKRKISFAIAAMLVMFSLTFCISSITKAQIKSPEVDIARVVGDEATVTIFDMVTGEYVCNQMTNLTLLSVKPNGGDKYTLVCAAIESEHAVILSEVPLRQIFVEHIAPFMQPKGTSEKMKQEELKRSQMEV